MYNMNTICKELGFLLISQMPRFKHCILSIFKLSIFLFRLSIFLLSAFLDFWIFPFFFSVPFSGNYFVVCIICGYLYFFVFVLVFCFVAVAVAVVADYDFDTVVYYDDVISDNDHVVYNNDFVIDDDGNVSDTCCC